MHTPTVTHRTTRPALGLTGKGRATVVLIRVRDNWETFTPDQREEVAELVARLAAALRRESGNPTPAVGFVARVPLVGRLSA